MLAAFVVVDCALQVANADADAAARGSRWVNLSVCVSVCAWVCVASCEVAGGAAAPDANAGAAAACSGS